MRGERAVEYDRARTGLDDLLADRGDRRLEVAEGLDRDRGQGRRETARVREQMEDGNALFAAVTELRDHVRDRRRERELPALDAGEHRDRGEGLGDRKEVKDIVDPGAACGRAIGEADRLVQGDHAAARDQDGGAVVTFVRDVGGDRRGQACEAFGVETELAGGGGAHGRSL